MSAPSDGATPRAPLVVTPALEMSNITAGYGRIEVLRGFNMRILPGTIVALLGPNGVGKTTALRVAAGLLSPSRGVVSLNGEDVTLVPPHARAKKGLCLIPEGRGIFRSLTVAENLRVQVPPWVDQKTSLDPVMSAFPVLMTRLQQRAGSLSGGEQQMLALARAYLSSPKVVLFDEVSMGLAPILVREVFVAIRNIASMGATLLIVEQYAKRAMEIADEIILVDRGTVTFSGPPSSLDQEHLVSHYLAQGKVRMESSTASGTTDE
jgi:branched-chain amino acid transport system ATP-binding protein